MDGNNQIVVFVGIVLIVFAAMINLAASQCDDPSKVAVRGAWGYECVSR